MIIIKTFLIAFFFLLSDGLSQQKFFICFKDKGVDKDVKLDKSSALYLSAIKLLSERSIQRRIKNMGEDNFITFEDLPVKAEYVQGVKSLGIKIDNELRWFNAVTAHLNIEQLSLLQQIDYVEKIEPVKTLIFSNPESISEFENTSLQKTDFDYGPSFGQLQLSEIPIVHSRGITGEGILIGLLDTGFDWKNHQSLINSDVAAEYDFVFNDSNTANDSSDNPSQHSHGTLVFSIVGGYKDSSLIGSAYGSTFLLAKTEDVRSETHVEEDNYAAALEWMEAYGVDITSSSLGYSVFDPSDFSYTYEDMDGQTTIVTRAAELAFRRGVVTITSAGNEGNSSWFYIIAPADGFNTLAIGAVNSGNVVADFSSRGPTFDGRIKPDLLAQGVSVYCAKAGDFDGYFYASGTSVAAPIASGVAALLLSAHPHLKNTQVRNIFFETADYSKTPDYERGYGLISALRAIEFPNLKYTSGSFMLTKTFLEKTDINTQTVKIYYSTGGDNYIEAPMLFDGEHSYTFNFPFLFEGDIVNFYITYKDQANNTFRDPFEDVYKFFYGQLDIQLNLDVKKEFTDFIVSEPYPNPFIPKEQTETYIDIRSSGNENLNVTIIDALGQQVSKFSIVTSGGINRVTWSGYTDSGILVASGAYYFLIDLNGKKYSRNLILLR